MGEPAKMSLHGRLPWIALHALLGLPENVHRGLEDRRAGSEPVRLVQCDDAHGGSRHAALRCFSFGEAKLRAVDRSEPQVCRSVLGWYVLPWEGLVEAAEFVRLWHRGSDLERRMGDIQVALPRAFPKRGKVLVRPRIERV